MNAEICVIYALAHVLTCVPKFVQFHMFNHFSAAPFDFYPIICKLIRALNIENREIMANFVELMPCMLDLHQKFGGINSGTESGQSESKSKQEELSPFKISLTLTPNPQGSFACDKFENSKPLVASRTRNCFINCGRGNRLPLQTCLWQMWFRFADPISLQTSAS